jgi:hypothetical protein
MTQMLKRAPPLIPQQLRDIIEANRSQSLYNESCDRSALMMPQTFAVGLRVAHVLPIVS